MGLLLSRRRTSTAGLCTTLLCHEIDALLNPMARYPMGGAQISDQYPP